VTLPRAHVRVPRRFISIAVPRMRDFRGLPTKSFDGRGNYSLGIKEQMIFPGSTTTSRAHSRDDITFVTSAGRDDTALALLRELACRSGYKPGSGLGDFMAKKAWLRG